MTGLNAESRPVFRSSDVKVAVVTASGKVTTKKYGSAVISCEVDGKTVKYYLAVSTKTAVRAMRYGYKKIGKEKSTVRQGGWIKTIMTAPLLFTEPIVR